MIQQVFCKQVPTEKHTLKFKEIQKEKSTLKDSNVPEKHFRGLS